MSIHSPNALMASWRDLSAYTEQSGRFRSIRGNPGPAVEELEQPFSGSGEPSGEWNAASGQRSEGGERWRSEGDECE